MFYDIAEKLAPSVCMYVFMSVSTIKQKHVCAQTADFIGTN